MARRRLNVFSLSFLDAMTCGFGAVILFFMVINGSVAQRAGRMSADLQAEVDLLEREVLENHRNLVDLRNSIDDIDEESVEARGLSKRQIDELAKIRAELATYTHQTTSRDEQINKLMADLKSLEEGARRLSAAMPSEETPGDKLRTFVGDGSRQYLTGLKVGGKRIFILLDASASMLDETIVNVIRRRNMPESVRIRSDKWQRAVSTVDWVTTQIPRDSQFQIYLFNERAEPLIPGTAGQWLDGGDREVLDQAIANLRQVVPRDGTNLHSGFAALNRMNPRPDNLILLVDGLPTRGASEPRGSTVSGKQRLRLFNRAIGELRAGVPVNVILFPMEGDPMAASAFWNLAIATRGSFLSPPRDWP